MSHGAPSSRSSAARTSLVALAAVLAVAAPAVADDVRVRTIEQDLAAGEVRSVSFHGPVGELRVFGGDADAAGRVRVELECDDDSPRCRAAADDVQLRVRRQDAELHLEVENWPKVGDRGLGMDIRLEIPRDRHLEIDWGVGEIEVHAMEAGVEIDLGVGEIAVRTVHSAFREIEMDSGVGEVELTVAGRTIDGSGFVSKSLSWSDGPGTASMKIDLGVGEIVVQLE